MMLWLGGGGEAPPSEQVGFSTCFKVYLRALNHGLLT